MYYTVAKKNCYSSTFLWWTLEGNLWETNCIYLNHSYPPKIEGSMLSLKQLFCLMMAVAGHSAPNVGINCEKVMALLNETSE